MGGDQPGGEARRCGSGINGRSQPPFPSSFLGKSPSASPPRSGFFRPFLHKPLLSSWGPVLPDASGKIEMCASCLL